MIIYNDLDDFRKIYAYHSKEGLHENNEIVVISSTYESPDRIKSNLESAGVDVRKYLLEGSLMIVDSMRSYHSSDVNGLLKLLASLHARDQRDRKNGVVCFGDPGTFFLLDKKQELVDYESTIPKKLHMKTRGFCCYHRANFETLNRQQKEKLLECHLKVL